MTSNERKIIKSLWGVKGRARIQHLADACSLSNDYARFICRSLARAGYIEFAGSNECHLLKKGQSQFENVTAVAEKSEPMIGTANVTLLTDEPAIVSPASDRRDEEENQEDGVSEDNDNDKPTSGSDEEPDKALADLELSSQKEGGEKIDEPEKSEKTESAEETEVQETGATETKPADNPAPAASLPARRSSGAGGESSEETAVMKKEEKREKEDATKPSDSSGWSFKKVVNWFAEKK